MADQRRSSGRQLDMESLKGLAHPLRVQIFDTLSVHGAFTASGLAERLGESSGATSYHLRQLERHGFVREVEGKGTGRERWWERMPGSISLDTPTAGGSAADRAAVKTVLREWERNRSALLADFQERGYEILPPEWIAATTVSTVNMRLTPDQATELISDIEELIASFVEKFRGVDEPGSRPVQVHFNAFPVLDGRESATADAARAAAEPVQKKGREKMSATTVSEQLLSVRSEGRAPRVRPRGIHLAAMRVGMAMLVWGRRRAERASMSRDDQLLLLANRRAVERLEYDNLRMTARLH